MKKTIKNVKVITNEGIISNGVIVFDGDTITKVGEASKVKEEGEVIDGEGLYAGPGFVDIHTHASDVESFVNDPITVAQYHLKAGTTSICPAIYFMYNADQYVELINLFKETSKDPRAKNIAGIYMEGPYLNPKFGCDKENIPWKKVDASEYTKVIDAAAGFAKVYCLAPEIENVKQYVDDVLKRDPGAVFAAAHTEASAEQVEALIPYGLKIGTHWTDATGKVHKWPDVEIVGVGVDEAVLMNDSMYAELIVDMYGIHVDPYMIRLALKVKGKDRIILITDANCESGPIPEGYPNPVDINFDNTGEISGTKLTLNCSARNMMKHTGCSIEDAFRFASYNPSQVVGFTDRGELAEGKRADIILVDDNINVHKVILAGEVQ